MLLKIIFFQVVLNSVSSFLIQDFSYNVTSSPHGQATGDTTIRDLMTLIVEEKRIRFQLEDRLNAAENEINKMKQYDVAVSSEMEKESKELERLRAQNQMLSDQLANMTAKNLLLESRIEHFTNLSFETRRETANLSMNVHNMELQIADVSRNLQNISDLDKFNSSSISIGFSLYEPVSGTGGNPSSTLKFSHIEENSAEAFNMTTGEFVCRQPGLYFFSSSVIRRSGTTVNLYCYFYINDIQHNFAGFASDEDQINTSGTNAILYHLLPGDTVSLRNCGNSDYIDPSSSFTGFLVHADN